MPCRLLLAIWFVKTPGERRGEDFDRCLSPDRVDVLAGILFGAAFFGSLVREPAASFAACFDFVAPRPAPLSTSLGPGLSGFCRPLPLRCALVLLGVFTFLSFLRNARSGLVSVSGGLTRLTCLFMTLLLREAPADNFSSYSPTHQLEGEKDLSSLKHATKRSSSAKAFVCGFDGTKIESRLRLWTRGRNRSRAVRPAGIDLGFICGLRHGADLRRDVSRHLPVFAQRRQSARRECFQISVFTSGVRF
jgi:hypothetical protein